MDIKRKSSIIQFIDSEIGKVSENAQKVKVTLTHSLSGYSAAGDTFHAQNAQGMVVEYLERLKRLKSEVENASVGKLDSAKPVSYVEIKYDDGIVLGFYLVKEAVSLSGYLLISSSSPLGKAILGKKAGNSFRYEIEQDQVLKKFKGVIVGIE